MANDINDRAHLALQQTEIHQDAGDDGQSGNGESGAEKERENERGGAVIRAEKAGKQFGGAEAEGEGNDHAENTDQQSALALAEDAAQINFNAGRKQKQNDAQRCDRIQYDRRITCRGEIRTRKRLA